MKKLLVVYNICGINGYQNIKYYLNALSSIRNQTMDNDQYDILVSSCQSKPEVLDTLSLHGYKVIEVSDKVPVNVTFNNAIIKAPSIFNYEHEAYVYIDSGVTLNDPRSLKKLYKYISQDHISMVSITCDSDEQHDLWGIDPTGSNNDLFIMPVGKATNLHCQAFSRELCLAYGRLVPDIFASFCTESTFSFLCAAIQTNWGIITDIVTHHETSMDGRSAGFSPLRYIKTTNLPTSNHGFIIPSVHQRLITQKAYELGFGYEEMRNVMMHNPSHYDHNGYCKNNELRQWIKGRLYLNVSEFDYNELTYSII